LCRSQRRTVLVAGGAGSGKTTLIDALARVLALVANHMKSAHVRDLRRSRLRGFVEQPDFKDHLELHRLDCLSSHGLLADREQALALAGKRVAALS